MMGNKRRGAGGVRAAIYARVSTVDQAPENQLAELGATLRLVAGLLRNMSTTGCPVPRSAGPPWTGSHRRVQIPEQIRAPSPRQIVGYGDPPPRKWFLRRAKVYGTATRSVPKLQTSWRKPTRRLEIAIHLLACLTGSTPLDSVPSRRPGYWRTPADRG